MPIAAPVHYGTCTSVLPIYPLSSLSIPPDVGPGSAPLHPAVHPGDRRAPGVDQEGAAPGRILHFNRMVHGALLLHILIPSEWCGWVIPVIAVM